ncbi:protocadherin gamma-A6-like [Anableps anableps]
MQCLEGDFSYTMLMIQMLFQVVATDSGTPSLSSNVTVNVFILDQNDNAPVILYPLSSNGSAEGVEEIPRNVNAGHLVTKEVTDHSLFGLDRYTGQIRTLRSFTETDEAEHKLVILVKDNGNVSLSATATVIVKLVEPKEAFAASDIKSAAKDDEDDNFHVVATDSGTPSLSSNVTVNVFILDQNDNAPVILYPLSSNGSAEGVEEIPRNVNAGHLVTKEVTDHSLFGLDRYTGQIRTLRSFTETDEAEHKLVILVKDNGNVSLSATATVIVKLVEPKEAFAASDVKRQEASAEIRYLVPEEVNDGTVVGNIAKDLGLDKALLVDRRFRVVPGSKETFFEVNSDDGALQVRRKIDREEICHGSGPCLVELKILVENPLEMHHVVVDIADVNDHYPSFSENEQTFEIGEQSSLGTRFQLHAARDPDAGTNSIRTYTLTSNDHFDIEVIQIVATDSGTPSLSSNVTVNVFILDQNDNAPVILYPLSSNGSAEGVEEIPRNVNAGHLVTKVRAYDADIGYNGWLLFSLQEVTDHSLFGLDRYTGQIRTLRSFTETDEVEHKLVILVKDNGNVSLSATATVIVKLVEPKEAFAVSDVKSAAKDDEDNNVTFYLMITLGGVSVLFTISIIVLIAMQCSKSTDYTSKYLQETNYDGTLCHSIQYRSGDKRETMESWKRSSNYSWCVLILNLLLIVAKQAVAELRYSVPEEVKEATVVGNIAKDLGLEKAYLIGRRLRIVSGFEDTFFSVNTDNGALQVRSKIDREELCHGGGACLMELKIIVENPLEMHHVVVEITDVNDNSPSFLEKEQHFQIAEHTSLGTRFQLQAARDPDVGVNTIRTYTLSSNEYFDIDLSQSDEDKIPFLVLKKPLDREENKKLLLLVTAIDGGKPPRSGTLNVSVTVLDINDNRPSFSQDVYQIQMYENVPVGTAVARVHATDPDEGNNGDIEYRIAKALEPKIYETFELNLLTGEIKLGAPLDFEESEIYKIDIEASDKGTPPLIGRCRVVVKITDVNDNSPKIDVTSLSNTISEDSKPGTAISLISVTDKDSGVNGKIISRILNDAPFELKPSYKQNIYSLVTKEHLDREKVSLYEILIQATDCGNPPLSTLKTLSIRVSDVNDNSPRFEKNPLQFYLSENNAAGASIFSVRATDIDMDDNAAISYYIVRGGSKDDVTAFLNINLENGQIYALKSFDFETLKTFHFQVVATDSGTPSLSSNVTVNVFILDQNDNAPVILYPLSSNGSAEGVEEIPRNVNAGHLVTKVRAYDADIGYNGWLLFSLQEVTDHSLFGLDRYTGQIRTLRSFTETDETEHKLVILVKDNGNVSLSATATVIVKLVEPKEAFAASDVKSAAKDDEDDNVTFYLMITLGSVSVLFIISIIVLIAMQCSKSTDYTSKYLQETNYDGTLCHSIQYRSGDKRYMLVGPRMSIGSTIVPGSHANTLVLPDRRRTSEEVSHALESVVFSSHLYHS